MTMDPNNPPSPYGDQPSYGQQPGAPQGQSPWNQPGNKYSTQAYQPGMANTLTQPPKYQTLKMLTLVSAALYLLSGILGLFGTDTEQQMRDQLSSAGIGVSDAELDSMVEAFATFGTVMGVGTLIISLLLYLLVYLGINKVRNWARILGIVLAAVGAVFTIYGVLSSLSLSGTGALSVVSSVLGLVFVVVGIIWIVVAVRSDVAGYFKAQPRG